jgi:hypothetical protein
VFLNRNREKIGGYQVYKSEILSEMENDSHIQAYSPRKFEKIEKGT